MIRRVSEDPQDVRRKLRSSDLPMVQERVRRSRSELIERSIDGGVEIRSELRRATSAGAHRLFGSERRELILIECLITGVREQAVQAAHRMTDMEAHGRRTVRACPCLLRREQRQQRPDILRCLDERMRDRLEQGGDPVDGAVKPDRPGDVRWHR